jgi:hypothetical protein
LFAIIMKKNINLELTTTEKHLLKENKIAKNNLTDLAVDEIIAVLQPQVQRARQIQALFDFQSIPSVGIRFAHDLMVLGYYRLSDIKERTGPDLLNEYEHKIGYKVDPCVEDQFWLVVDHANNPDSKR